jgi:cell division transport system permease protein
MRRLAYFFGEGIRGLVQARLMTVVSIMAVAASLFVAGVLGIGMFNVHQRLGSVSEQTAVVAYLTDACAADSVTTALVVKDIEALPHVKSVSLVTKKDAWTRFSELYGTDMLVSVDSNPLPASAEILLNKKYLTESAIDSLNTQLSGIAGIETVRYARDWVRRLETIRTWFLWALIIVLPILLVALHAMIANTIKLTIYARRELVSNMRMVGATDRYIEAPFVIEGVLQGVAGGGIAVLLLTGVHMLAGNSLIYWGPWWFLWVLVIIGFIFGLLGSLSAVRRFLG